MTWVIALLAILVFANLVFMFVIFRRSSAKPVENNGQGEAMQLLLTQINHLSSGVNQNIKEMIEKVTRIDETGKQMVGYAGELESLKDMLKNPKQRGVLGEYYLETILKNTLPPGSYQMQYPFPDGTIVDAVIFIKDKIVPIDSKFSLENYNRIMGGHDEGEKKRFEKVFENDLKQRIIETSKYIRPQDKTVDFAFMFIPHEAIYYDLIAGTVGQNDEENLIQRAASKYRVIAVSPTSLLAYLQTVLQGLNALQIEEQAQEIVKRVGELGKHLKAYEEYHLKLGNTLGTAVNHFNASNKELSKVDKDVLRITGSSVGMETLTLERPTVE
jgi:DNA recombination protein RmuC